MTIIKIIDIITDNFYEKKGIYLKIKNLRINTDILPGILKIVLLAAAMGGGGLCDYTIESQNQIEVNDNSDDIFYDDLGNTCKHFDIGEHKIKISRNDIYYHNVKMVEGYQIENVKINGWRDNSQVTYVNTVPVDVIGTVSKNGKIEFDHFGVVTANTKTR